MFSGTDRKAHELQRLGVFLWATMRCSNPNHDGTCIDLASFEVWTLREGVGSVQTGCDSGEKVPAVAHKPPNQRLVVYSCDPHCDFFAPQKASDGLRLKGHRRSFCLLRLGESSQTPQK